MKNKIKTFLVKIVDRPETCSGRRFLFFIQILILVSLVTFSIETLPGLTPGSKEILHWFEVVTVAIFTLEYMIRLWTSNNRLRYIFSFYGLVDLLAILPFYLSTALDLRGIRALRLMRLFRVLKLARYNRAIHRFARAFFLAREELVLFFSATVLVIYASAVGIYYFERDAQPEAFASVFHALWWAVETLTTVGYGDTFPVTLGGRIFTFFMVMCGLGIVGMPAGIMASSLTRAAREEEEEKEEAAEVGEKAEVEARAAAEEEEEGGGNEERNSCRISGVSLCITTFSSVRSP